MSLAFDEYGRPFIIIRVRPPLPGDQLDRGPVQPAVALSLADARRRNMLCLRARTSGAPGAAARSRSSTARCTPNAAALITPA